MINNIYIAGPMRGVSEFNFPAFFAAEKMLSEAGWHVFNPARNDIEKLNLNVTGMKGDMSEIPEFNLREALIWDMNRILESSAIYMLKGWEHSSGARAEHALATTLQLQVVYE